MRLITKTRHSAWHTQNGRALVHLLGNKANVDICAADPDELEALATACLEAASELRYLKSISAAAPDLPHEPQVAAMLKTAEMIDTILPQRHADAAAERDEVAVS